MTGVVRRWSAPLAGALSLTLMPLASLGSPALAAPGSPCSLDAVSLSLRASATAYGPGSRVHLTAAVTNRSSEACDVVVGGTSPWFQVTGPSGGVVWHTCVEAGAPRLCPMYLAARTIEPGQEFRAAATWDQLVAPATRGRDGSYLASVHWSGLATTATTAFRLVGVAGRPLALAAGDAGSTVAVRVGQRLTLTLARPSLYRWSAPTSSHPGVVRVISSTHGATARATLIARAPGTTQLRATGTPTCYPQCLVASRLVTITVTVTP